MRVRSEEKRLEIVVAAADLFVELGYEHTTMSAISDRVGGSKATLYGYFKSKEELLRAVLAYDVAQEALDILKTFPLGEDLRAALVELGAQYLNGRLDALAITNMRTLASLPADSDIGKEFYATVLRPAWELLADQFRALMAAGRLRSADPWTAAMHWKGLNEAELLEPRLIGASSVPKLEEVSRITELAADAFLTIYGTDEAAEVD